MITPLASGYLPTPLPDDVASFEPAIWKIHPKAQQLVALFSVKHQCVLCKGNALKKQKL